MDNNDISGSELIPDEEEHDSSDSEFFDISDIVTEAKSEDRWSYIRDLYSDTNLFFVFCISSVCHPELSWLSCKAW